MEKNRQEAVDVHAHYGRLTGSAHEKIREFSSLDMGELGRLFEKAGVSRAFCSPLEAIFPDGGGDSFAANSKSPALARDYPWLYIWAVLDPRDSRTFLQAEELLKNPKCVGLKLHPELHHYPITEFGDAIFSFAARHGAVVETHSGEANSMPEDMVVFANRYPEMTLIASHLGCGFDGDPTHQVRGVLGAKNGNFYTDTSSGRSMTPGLIEWAVKEIGAEKLFFGTDSPLYFTPMQRARIDCADLSDGARALILQGNAQRVFPKVFCP